MKDLKLSRRGFISSAAASALMLGAASMVRGSLKGGAVIQVRASVVQNQHSCV